jgi:hypothetical protein
MTSIAFNTLPVELWNIVLTFTPHSDAKRFIYISLVYKTYFASELEALKTKYVYDYLISTTPLHKCIYKIYNTINTINTNAKYFKEFNKVYQITSNISYDRINAIKLKNYLADKITNEKQRKKFDNLTNNIFAVDVPPNTNTNTNYNSNMLQYL